MIPSILIQEVEILEVSWTLCQALVVKHPKAMERIGLPTARIAKFPTWVIKHSIAIELVFGVEFALILGAIAKEVLSIIIGAEVIGGEVASGRIRWLWWLREGVKQFHIADRSAL